MLGRLWRWWDRLTGGPRRRTLERARREEWLDDVLATYYPDDPVTRERLGR